MGKSAASEPGKTWYVYANGEVKGPYPREDVFSLMRIGLIASDAQFNTDGRWICRDAFEAYNGGAHEGLAELESIASTEGTHQVAGEGLPPHDSALPSPLELTPSPVEIPDASTPVRDRIVVIGRRASGKTIYLAELYHDLWKSRDGLCMKALSGRSHKELMAVHETLRQGRWPAATDKTTVLQMEFELQYRGRSQTLVGLDYAGEVFRDAFVNDDTESPQAKALISHIDRALAVILLIDPAIAVSSDSSAMIDDDYGIVQAVQRVRDWPGGEDVPVVLLLTKADQNRSLFTDKKSTRQFIDTHYPALVRTLKTFKVFHVSAVQTVIDKEGKLHPRAESVPLNVLESLKYCLDCLGTQEEREQIREQQRAEQESVERMLQFQAQAEHKSNLRLAWLIGAIITIGVCLTVLIIVFRS